MTYRHTIAWFLVILPLSAVAQDDGKYRCTQGDLVRRVEILTEPGVPVPCEVHYYKDSEAPGEAQVLWSAQNQAGYCQAKTEEFIAQLEGWGWDCGQNTAMPAGEEPVTDDAADSDDMDEEPVRDDTDVLSPGNPGNG